MEPPVGVIRRYKETVRGDNRNLGRMESRITELNGKIEQISVKVYHLQGKSDFQRIGSVKTTQRKKINMCYLSKW